MNYFDLHCDTAGEIFKRKTDFSDDCLAVNFKNPIFEKWCQVFAFFIKDDEKNPFEKYKNILSYFKEKTKCIKNLPKYILSVEGGAVLEGDVEKLFTLKQDNIKILSLAWNGETALAGGVNSEAGLTESGRSVTKAMNRLKMACDVSHLNEKSFYKAVEISHFPLATHSNCYSLCPNPRNLKDKQIDAIAEKGGIVGLCFYPEFLTGDVMEAIYKNIFHLCDKGYEDIIAIGSDFDGAQMDKKLDKVHKVPMLYGYLEEKGINKSLLSKIFYKNAEKFIAKL